MTFLSRRIWLLASVATLFAGGTLGVACSNNGGFNDGGVDGSKPGDSGGGDTKPPGDSGGNDGGGNDGSSGPCTTTALTGACDIVAQNCPSGQECAAVQTDGGFQAQCIPNSTGNIKEGYACTQSGNNNPCVAGLECIDNRCAKHCCLGDDTACGKAQPEGYTGRCETTVTLDGTNPAYAICTYSAGCEPFQIQPCTSGEVCSVEDKNGTAVCQGLANTDGGLSVGVKCVYANDCKDGLACVGALDGGAAICTYQCYVPPGPFDAGITSLGAGKGGCQNGKTCQAIQLLGPDGGVTNPTWLGLCE